MITKFRKKPVVIEATRVTSEGFEYVLWWIRSSGTDAHRNVRRADGAVVLVIETLEGEMAANLDDWVIKGVKGEFYPCKPDIFEATYEPAEPSGISVEETDR